MKTRNRALPNGPLVPLLVWAAVLGLLAAPLATLANEMSSESFTLIGGTLSGGGGIDLQSTAAEPTVSALGVTIGQSSPLGTSTSASGITLEAGFWPIVALGGSSGGPDTDGDGEPDATDNCPDFANADQLDSDDDGIGDACECGDFSGDGVVNTLDARLVQRCTVGAIPCADLCDVTGEGTCNTIDARLIQRFAVGQLTKNDLFCAERP